jgi:hypothetical protein
VQGTTEYALKFLQRIAGNQPIVVDEDACRGGKNKNDIGVLNDGSILLSHATENHSSFTQGVALNGVIRHLVNTQKNDFNQTRTALLDFPAYAASHLETDNISYKKSNTEIFHHTARPPEKNLKQASAYKKYIKDHTLKNYSEFIGKNAPELTQALDNEIQNLPFREYL